MFTDNINNYINTKYDEIKSILKREWFKRKTIQFDEDIFHDTLIKCVEKFSKGCFEESEFMPYIIRSFQNNIVRNEMYFVNAKRDKSDVTTIKQPIFDSYNIDIKLVLETITKTFSELYCNIFLDWLDGCTIKELNELYGRNNCRYVVDKIRKFILEKYNHNEFS